jgi:outer membrane protein OmpA-like peptidoglycan-associated protein
MKQFATPHRLLQSLCLVVALLLAGCATPAPVPSAAPAPRSVIVLLPEGDKPSGVVTVTNAQGTQELNQSWQSVEISGEANRPASPVLLGEKAVQGAFGTVLAAMPASPVHFLLYFKFNTSELLPESQLLLPEIARVIKERRPAQLSVVGHTDTAGSTQYNYRLGLSRAARVAELLAAQGAVPASIETSSRGKAELQVKTPDQCLEPRNRRAEVTIR